MRNPALFSTCDFPEALGVMGLRPGGSWDSERFRPAGGMKEPAKQWNARTNFFNYDF